ncbi:HlyD family secretion protein [Flavivirga jejuensis]|uniref:HlyD family efflux transporter periplasmic adaptor subunit n=1 Tax=Flavivirga jejuensis TaxID=870487 RepID=A0ABT8WWD9_9FLAO|nr:HlyD family efflux transporter periplasmic adaptor subunit [Flavivirga jejuensis]MDO5977172.1 HlyD family efflux transporter periplasmic adaptor subunit [Flavivirga jejuensis]
MKQIFPKEIIENTIEAHQFKHSKQSKIIYTIILITLITIISLLPCIHVDIYTSARGFIKPDKERLIVTSINSGKVISTNLKNNIPIQKGDTLLALDNTIINEKLNLSKHQTDDINLFIDDLIYLINSKKAQNSKIKSPRYKKEYLLYNQKVQELYTRRKKLKKDYDRSKTLFEKGVIARVEFENVVFDYDLVINSLYQLKQQQSNIWQTALTEYKNDLLEIESVTKQLQDNKSQFVVTAPITGTLISVKSIEKGSFLNAGDAFASISPNTTLLVECLISPQDIGLLKLNNQVNFQIDAYNYNQWGLATGNVIEISKDIELIENASVFKVLCHINEDALSLKNGFEGKLKKGMSLNAQFKLTERTLFDLLYDKVDDWVNPSQKELATIN